MNNFLLVPLLCWFIYFFEMNFTYGGGVSGRCAAKSMLIVAIFRR
jgi:hypothetical protein